ncbi:MAG: hypothetical protein JNK88_10585 [Mangrovicoccus sp.]|nr:hypothetical protein [Mangrovicoccus sp.]
MRELTGQDEMAFLDRQGGGVHSRLAGLAVALDVAALPVLAALDLAAWEDRLLGLRARLMGRRIEAEAQCPACAARVALIFSADDLPREPDPAGPLGPLHLGDLLALEAEGLGGEAGLAALLAAATGLDRDTAAARLAGPDRDDLVAALEARAAGLGLEIGTACTECGAAMTVPFDIARFLDTELGGRAARLLDEVHLIASAYHWSEAAILALPAGRRRAYLDRILAASALGALAPMAGAGRR